MVCSVLRSSAIWCDVFRGARVQHAPRCLPLTLNIGRVDFYALSQSQSLFRQHKEVIVSQNEYFSGFQTVIFDCFHTILVTDK